VFIVLTILSFYEFSEKATKQRFQFKLNAFIICLKLLHVLNYHGEDNLNMKNTS